MSKQGLTIQEVATELDAQLFGNENSIALDVSHDSRQVREGTLFVAIKGVGTAGGGQFSVPQLRTGRGVDARDMQVIVVLPTATGDKGATADNHRRRDPTTGNGDFPSQAGRFTEAGGQVDFGRSGDAVRPTELRPIGGIRGAADGE